MTKTEFYEQLMLRRESYGFELINGCIREKRTGKCPVVAVATRMGKRRLAATDETAAAETIGLPTKFAWDVSSAADGFDGCNPRIRRKLLRLCGLSKAKVSHE